MRVCKDCGKPLPEKSRAWYCAECKKKRNRISVHNYQKKRAGRNIGDVDYCKKCGNEYIVEKSSQHLCPNCQDPQKIEDQRKYSNRRREKIKRIYDKLSQSGIMICRNCSKVFPHEDGGAKICSDCQEKKLLKPSTGGVIIGNKYACKNCGEEFTATYQTQKYCEKCSKKQRIFAAQKGGAKSYEADKKLLKLFDGVIFDLPPKVDDLTGKKFGRLTAIGYIGQSKWRCVCECGNTSETKASALKSGKSKSCGCLAKEQAAKNGQLSIMDLKGKRFGKLKVIEYAGKSTWKCLCDCGNTCYVAQNNLTRKNNGTKSCGCLVNLDKANKENIQEDTNIGLIKSDKVSSRNKTTGVKGVYFCNGKYRTYISFQHKRYYLGSSSKLEDCIKLRKIAEEKIYGEFLKWYYEERKKDDN